MQLVAIIVLVAVALAFAWSMGAHYTGAVMGMPYSSRSISFWPALAMMSVMTVLGATFLSFRVQYTVGYSIVDASRVSIAEAVVIVLAAAVLTTIYTYFKVPTSTIQILVFCVVGMGLAAGIPVHWGTIGKLALVWVLAPPVAVLLGFLLTRLLDTFIPAGITKTQEALGIARTLPPLLVAVGAAASLVLGANDVSNATGVFLMAGVMGVTLAGLLGGLAMAVGALTWGRRILSRVAFDVVHLDLSMASAAQFVQALVVILAVTQGLFTSMNQALIGAMAGTGLARGKQTVQWRTLLGIVEGWLISPISGLTIAYVLTRALLLLKI
jgi:PiT family inorganic phosphate transporter